MRFTFILPAFISLSVFCQQAENVPLRFQRITQENGLPHNYVHAVTQDKKGFIWIGTNYGLARYDGYNFKVFQPEPLKPHSITHKPIGNVYADSRGYLWLTVNGGVNRMDLQTERFSGYFFDATKKISLGVYFRVIHEDSDSNIWIASNNGLFTYNNKTDSFEYALSKMKFGVSDYEIMYLADDEYGNIWFEIDNRIAILNKSTREISTIGEYIADPAFDNISFHSVYSFEKGIVWLSSYQNGLYRFNITTRKFEHFLEDTGFLSDFFVDSRGNLYMVVNNPYRLLICRKEDIGTKKFEAYALYESENYHKAVIIKEDRFNNIWFSSMVGLTSFNFKTGITKYHSNSLYPNTISSNSIENIFIDRTDNLWICPYRKGINKADLRQNPFRLISYPIKSLDEFTRDRNVNCVYEDSKNNIWFSDSDNGLCAYNKSLRKYFRFSLNTNDNPVTAIYEDNDGSLWLGTYWSSSLFRVKPPAISQWDEKREMKFESIARFNISGVREIVCDKSNNLWFATLTGLVEFNRKANAFFNHSASYDSLNNFSSFYRTIFLENDHTIWTGSNSGGLCKYDLNNRTFKHYLNNPANSKSIGNNTVYAIYKDNNGSFFVGTGQGLYRFNAVMAEFEQMGVSDGLNKKSIYSIIPDTIGNLWLSCDDLNIVRYHIQSNRSRSYGPADGLQNIEFSTTANFLSKDGEIFFGGTNGIISFFPSEIKVNPILAKPTITNIRISNKIISPGDSLNGRVLFDRQVWETKKIRLRYYEADITIEFSALHYAAPEKVVYQYKLDGYNTDWLHTDAGRRYATYTGLPPGEYTFYLKSTNNDGLISQPADDASITIIIVPPFWQRIWFKILVMLGLISLALLYIWIRIRSLKNLNILLNDKVKERTTELEKANQELDQHRNRLEFLVENRTRELENALLIAEESSRLKTSFLTNMSHEIRTPMNAIIGFSSLLKDKALDEKEHDEYINIITSSGYTLLTLINDILDLSSLQAQQVSLNPENVRLLKLLENLLEMHQISIKQKEVSLRLNINSIPGDFQIICDEIRLTQVFSNLISNAGKFTSSGYIEFGVYEITDNVVFFVKDTGIGIDTETGEAIFERFYKIEKDNRKLYRGAGLGLAICKNIVSLWNGDIWYESEAGKGSTFFFSHPLSLEAKIQIDEVIESEVTHLDLKGIIILIAEDEESNFKLLYSYFRNTHAEILWAKNGLEAIRIADENPVDIILMDIKMPVMNGIEAARRIMERHPDVPVIAQTAYAFKTEVDGFMKNGIHDYLIKPIHKSKLFSILKRHLRIN